MLVSSWAAESIGVSPLFSLPIILESQQRHTSILTTFTDAPYDCKNKLCYDTNIHTHMHKHALTHIYTHTHTHTHTHTQWCGSSRTVPPLRLQSITSMWSVKVWPNTNSSTGDLDYNNNSDNNNGGDGGDGDDNDNDDNDNNDDNDDYNNKGVLNGKSKILYSSSQVVIYINTRQQSTNSRQLQAAESSWEQTTSSRQESNWSEDLTITLKVIIGNDIAPSGQLLTWQQFLLDRS